MGWVRKGSGQGSSEAWDLAGVRGRLALMMQGRANAEREGRKSEF